MIYIFFLESIFTVHGSAVEPAINLQVSSKSQESHSNYKFEIVFGEDCHSYVKSWIVSVLLSLSLSMQFNLFSLCRMF